MHIRSICCEGTKFPQTARRADVYGECRDIDEREGVRRGRHGEKSRTARIAVRERSSRRQQEERMYTANAETSTNAKAFGEVGMAKRADPRELL